MENRGRADWLMVSVVIPDRELEEGHGKAGEMGVCCCRNWPAWCAPLPSGGVEMMYGERGCLEESRIATVCLGSTGARNQEEPKHPCHSLESSSKLVSVGIVLGRQVHLKLSHVSHVFARYLGSNDAGIQ